MCIHISRGCFGNPDFEILILIERGYYVPSIYGMRRTGTSNHWFLMDLDSGSRKGKRGAVEPEHTMELRIFS